MVTQELSDNDLHALARKYGGLSLEYRRKFVGLLPEIYKRHIYKKHGINSIHEYAAKLAGVSSDVVDKVLRLYDDLEVAPILRAKLVDGEVGWAKLAEVAKVATEANQTQLADCVTNMSFKSIREMANRLQLQEPISTSLVFSGAGDLYKEKFEAFTMKLSPGTLKKLRILKQRIAPHATWEVSMKEILKMVGIGTSKVKSKRKFPNKIKENYSRAIPIHIKEELELQYGGACAFSGCGKAAEHYHHTKPWAQFHSHEGVVPLCKTHHEIAHNGLLGDNWQVKLGGEKSTIDKSYISHRLAASRN